MAYIIKDKDGHPIVTKDGKNVMGMDNHVDMEVKDFSNKERSLLAVASVESPDRFKDCIMVDGWEMKNYRKNPVVLAFHSYSSLPIARSLEEFSDEKRGVKRLMFRPQFAAYPDTIRIFEMFRDKFLAGFSVGFLPRKSAPIDDKKKKEDDDHPFFHTPTRFLKQELLEISAVSVPASPDALAEIKTMVKKGSLYIPVRYLQEKQTPETEIYDEYIHVKVEDEGRFKMLYEDEFIDEGVIRVFGPVDDEGEFVDHKYIFAKERYTEEEAVKAAEAIDKDYPDAYKNYDPEAYTVRETVLIDAFPVLDEKAFAEKKGREELETANTNTDGTNDQSGEGEECEECSGDSGREYIIGEDIEFAEEEYINEEDVEEKPFPNEHACRLLPPGNFDRFARKNCFRRSGGKCIDFIFGIKAGKSKTQSMRYKKDVWTASAARAHCRGADGSFEAAGKSGEKIYVYSTEQVLETEDAARIREHFQAVLGKDAKILILDQGGKLSCVEGNVDIVPVSEEEKEADKKASLEKFKVQVEKQWGVLITDEMAEVLMGLSEKMDLDLVKAVLDVSDALSALKPKKGGGLHIVDEADRDMTSEPIESALKSQTEELKAAVEKIFDEVVERVVRAVRTELKSMRGGGKTVDEDETINLDIEEDLEDEDFENDGTENADENEDAEIEGDELATVVSDSLKEALGRLD